MLLLRNRCILVSFPHSRNHHLAYKIRTHIGWLLPAYTYFG